MMYRNKTAASRREGLTKLVTCSVTKQGTGAEGKGRGQGLIITMQVAISGTSHQFKNNSLADAQTLTPALS